MSAVVVNMMDMQQIEFRAVIKFLTKQGKGPQAILNEMTAVYGEKRPGKTMIYKWCSAFQEGREMIEDKPRALRLKHKLPGTPQTNQVENLPGENQYLEPPKDNQNVEPPKENQISEPPKEIQQKKPRKRNRPSRSKKSANHKKKKPEKFELPKPDPLIEHDQTIDNNLPIKFFHTDEQNNSIPTEPEPTNLQPDDYDQCSTLSPIFDNSFIEDIQNELLDSEL